MKPKKYKNEKFSIILKLIYTVNILMGTMPIFYKNKIKTTVVFKNFRKLYIISLFIVTIIFMFRSKVVIPKFSEYKKGFNLRLILKITAIISIISSACLCWIVSLTLSDYHMKIINNNSKINKLLMVNRKKKRVPLLNGTMCLSIIFAIANIILSFYFTYNSKDFSFIDMWFHILISAKDWFIIIYLMHQKLNIYYLKLIINNLKAICDVNQSPSLDIDTIIIVFGKLHENNTSAKYLISFPVNF